MVLFLVGAKFPYFFKLFKSIQTFFLKKTNFKQFGIQILQGSVVRLPLN